MVKAATEMRSAETARADDAAQDQLANENNTRPRMAASSLIFDGPSIWTVEELTTDLKVNVVEPVLFERDASAQWNRLLSHDRMNEPERR